MPLLGVLLIAAQIFFAVHAVRNGKDPIWLWLIILVPGIGCAIYFITQFGPDAVQGRTARKARQTLVRAVDPQRELRRRMTQLEVANTVENRIALADECIEAGLHDTAIELLEQSLSGVHEHDPAVLHRLATAYFANDDAAACLRTLDLLIEHNPGFRSPEAHLLYARALEGLGRYDDARKEYDVLRESFPGEEARVRYGLLLKSLGQHDAAAELFREALTRAGRAPAHYRKKEKPWLKIAERGESG